MGTMWNEKQGSRQELIHTKDGHKETHTQAIPLLQVDVNVPTTQITLIGQDN